MKFSKIQFAWFLLLLGCFVFPNNIFAQQEKEVNKKIVIVKKTIDKDGNEKVEKIIKEGDEANDFDVDKYIKINDVDANEINVEVEVTMEGEEETKKEKTVEVTVEGENVIIKEGGEKTVIKIDEESDKKEIKTEDGKHIIIMKKDLDGDDVDVNTLLEEMEINVEEMEDGTKKEIRIMKTRKGNGAFFGVMIDPTAEGLELLDVVKGSPAEKIGLKKGDVLRSIAEHNISNYEELTEALSKYKPGDSVVVTYKSDGEIKKANVLLEDAKTIPMEKKMIWKTKDGEEIEIDDKHEFHFEEGEEGKKKIKKKIIIKKDKGN